jgi:triosephosphate isomerase
MFTQCQNDDINYINFISEYLCKQLQNALDVGITPIFCIGESIEERLSGNYENFLLQQLSIIKKINNVKQIIIAYEPVWSIGTGITPTIQQILEITTMIRRFLTSCQLLTTSHVIYGGSVNSNNILEIIKNSSIDGVLIGGASLKWQNFTELVKLCS